MASKFVIAVNIDPSITSNAPLIAIATNAGYDERQCSIDEELHSHLMPTVTYRPPNPSKTFYRNLNDNYNKKRRK